jgi:hypothetical protein
MISLVCADLAGEHLPFPPRSFGLVLIIDFFPTDITHAADLIAPGGYLFFESIQNRGENYLELPRAGQLRAALKELTMVRYLERKAGPPDVDAVTVKLIAQRGTRRTGKLATTARREVGPPHRGPASGIRQKS